MGGVGLSLRSIYNSTVLEFECHCLHLAKPLLSHLSHPLSHLYPPPSLEDGQIQICSHVIDALNFSFPLKKKKMMMIALSSEGSDRNLLNIDENIEKKLHT